MVKNRATPPLPPIESHCFHVLRNRVILDMKWSTDTGTIVMVYLDEIDKIDHLTGYSSRILFIEHRGSCKYYGSSFQADSIHKTCKWTWLAYCMQTMIIAMYLDWIKDICGVVFHVLNSKNTLRNVSLDHCCIECT